MTPDYQGLATAIVVASLVPALVGLGLYLWYGFALSRLFPKLGAEGWKGWVPILNEIEILVRGGVPGWSVVFYFIPVVQLYGIYLKALAVHRINESFGRGAGFTVLGIFLPPLWATLLAGGRMPAAGDYDRRVEGLMSAAEAAPARTPDADALGAGPFVAQPAAYASAPPPPPSAPVPVAFPSLAPASEPPLFDAPPVPAAPRPPAPEPEPAAPEAPAQAPEPGTVYNPWAQGPPAAPVPPPVATPAAPPAAPEPVVVPEPVIQLTPPPAVESTAPAPAVAVPPVDEDDDDDEDRTVVVDRRPQVPWRLVTDEGHVIPLRTRTIILGRKPTAAADGVDVIAVPDSTKTLSKNHARLELSEEGAWTVFDLDSTNGVIIIEADGTETLLPQGGSAAVPGRFMLGKVAMRVSFDDTEATR
ncbi:MAG: hypothetical protein JWR04_16 [Rhodoglobus sp.]|nr:hypothetical protein [Rhodoglobus sp.]